MHFFESNVLHGLIHEWDQRSLKTLMHKRLCILYLSKQYVMVFPNI